jgi:hypothetical protein
MNSDNTQQRLTFGLAVFVSGVIKSKARSKDRSLRQLLRWDGVYQLGWRAPCRSCRVKRGCDLLIVFLIHNVSKTQKKPPEQAAKREFRQVFGHLSSECADYPHRPPGSEINSDYAADRRQHCFAMKRGRSGWGIYRTGLVRCIQRHYPTD